MRASFASFWLIGGVLLSASGCSTVENKRAATEYRVETMWVKTAKPLAEFQEYLNAQSREGWELVSFEEHDNNFRVVLRRQDH
jgi:hypothetical protein